MFTSLESKGMTMILTSLMKSILILFFFNLKGWLHFKVDTLRNILVY